MTQFDIIKKRISVATVYCRENYPDEVIRENGQIKDVTICGICRYIESKVD